MAYSDECTGSVTVDRQSTNYGGYQPDVYMDQAYAQRFIPSSRCLDNIYLRMKRDQNYDIYIEIKNDLSGVPSGSIGSGYLKQYIIPYNSVPTSFNTVNIPLQVLLPDINPKWIVMYSQLYDPNYFDPTVLFEIDGDTISDSSEYVALKIGNNNWNSNPSIKFYFQTYKKNLHPTMHNSKLWTCCIIDSYN